MRKTLLLVALCSLVACHALYAQADSTKTVKRRFREYKRTFHISIFPGIGTNGVYSGHYFNDYSINLFGGSSAGNRVLELGFVTNSSFKRSTGIQLAGLANIVGANAFLNLSVGEERTLINNDFKVDFQGIHLAGMLNYVLDNAKGIQLSGGLNVVGRNFTGVQVAGIGNSAGEMSMGFHLAGLYNVAAESVGGAQISGIFNFTGEELAGVQIALINKARSMMGKHSTPPNARRGLQIGLINFAKEMHGLQIGLINFGGEFRGKQIGLINFFDPVGTKEAVPKGTPVGLLNFGRMGFSRVYFNEMFPTNIEITTGNCVNCTLTQSTMPYWDANKKLNQNTLIFSYDYWTDRWGFGYGFQKLLYNKSSMNPKDVNNARRLITYGARLLNMQAKETSLKDLNLVTRLNFDWGSCYWGKKRKSYYWYVGMSLNYFLHEAETFDTTEINSLKIDTGSLMGMDTMVWPGYNIGIHL